MTMLIRNSAQGTVQVTAVNSDGQDYLGTVVSISSINITAFYNLTA